MSITTRIVVLLGALFILAGCGGDCEFDNTDFWRPNDHGDYNCLGDCSTGSCQLEALVNGSWVALGKSREDRDVVDEMAGQPIPTGNDPPTAAPTWVRCRCY